MTTGWGAWPSVMQFYDALVAVHSYRLPITNRGCRVFGHDHGRDAVLARDECCVLVHGALVQHQAAEQGVSKRQTPTALPHPDPSTALRATPTVSPLPRTCTDRGDGL